ncbi:MAG: hypothetical protein JWO04_4979 [Gammaproteobacteria bacterium]|nr:hypothetical protein [Gammaproteobacteria bacterium]
MLSNPLQYSPQSLLPQFPGLQSAGLPQMSPGLFGQPGAYNGTAQFGHDFGQAAVGQQFPFGAQTNPYLQSQLWQGPGAHNPFLSSFGGHTGASIPAHQIVPVLGQLAQQIAVQSAVAQQIGMAVQQLAHQLALQGQGLQGYPGAQGLQGYPGGQGGYGLGPQAQGWGQAWGASRPQQTIQ